MGISSASCVQKKQVIEISFLEKQKFLYEIVHRLRSPLLIEEYIVLGEKLNTNKDQYEVRFDKTGYDISNLIYLLNFKTHSFPTIL